MIKKKKGFKKVLLILCIIISIIFFSILITITILYHKYDLDIDKLTSQNNGIRVYSSTGIDNTLYNTDRSIVEIETLPDYVPQAFIDIEDKRFYEHNGFDIKRIVKASMVNLASQSKSQGASTISQQLIKNALLDNKKTYARKIKEIILSIKLEKEFTKDEILEMYLNTIYFGSNAYGIENASMTYFNKSAKDLSINEVCCLAGLIKSPNYYSPKNNYNNAIKRRNLVAEKMLSAGNISNEQYDEVLSSDLVIAAQKQVDHSYEEEAIIEACRLLNISERELINNKYQIITFKNDDLQQAVVEINNKIITSAEDNTASNLDSLSVVADNDGKILAYYANSHYDLHGLKRQPASTLKPLAVYLPCISHNILSSATEILDEEIDFNGFSPQNADMKYHGYVTTREALAHSLNVPAVKALDYVGLKKSREMLTNLGINISNSDMNLSLALGAVKNGVNILELMNAYSTIANMGEYHSLSFVDKILDSQGNTIYSHDDFNQKVVDADSCFILTDMLKDSTKYGTAKRMASLNIPIASKTGTASVDAGNTDLYNVAYTTEHTILTWIANIGDGLLPSNLLSSSQPTDINKDICQHLYKDKAPKDFDIPAGVSKYPFDLIEKEENHTLIAPLQNKERYIGYDYFKHNNAPIVLDIKDDVYLKIDIDKAGANITFDAKKNRIYLVHKRINGVDSILQEISDTNNASLIDYEIFSSEEIEYYITDENGEVISNSVTIRPKDFIINRLNIEILSNKKKWYV